MERQRWGYKEMERQRDVDKQPDRETERHRCRDADKQRDREIEINGEIEMQIN